MKKIYLLASLFFASPGMNAQTVLLSEGFNVTSRTTTPPTGWTVSGTGSGTNDGGSCSSAVDWEQVPSGGFSATCFPGGTGNPLPNSYKGTGMAGFNSWSIGTPRASELVTPALNFSGAGTTTLSVWIYEELNYNPGYDSLRIFVNTSPGSTGTNSTMLYAGAPSYSANNYWTQYTFNIPSTYSGTTNYIIFRAVSQYRNDIFFDSVTVIRNPPTPCSGTPSPAVITNTAISTANPICSGNTVTLNATDPNYPTVGGFTYQWQTSGSSSGPWTTVSTATSTTNGTLSYNTGALSTSTYYRLNIVCTATGNSATSTPYYVPVGAPQPAAITGSATFCPGDAATYSVTNVSGTTYSWTLPSGWSGSSTSNSITVTPGSGAGTISVTATSSCGTSIAQTKAITAGSAPAAPTSITGNTNPCVNSSQVYSIASVPGATSYNWTVPSGWNITSTTGGGTSITATTSANSGNIVVSAINGCGSSSKTIAVNVISSLPNPGTITGSTTACANSTTAYTYSINPIPGATSYVWSVPNGWNGTNSGTTIQLLPNSTGGQIKVTAYSACATSPTSTLNVSIIPSVTPAVSVTTTSAPICTNTATTFTASATNGGSAPVFVWKKNGVQVGGTSSTYLDNRLANNDILSVSLVSNATCRTADTTTTSLTLAVTPQAATGISINSNPMITICSGSPISFNTTYYGGGSTPSFQWYRNFAPISGATSPTYSTTALNNNDTITVTMKSNAVCPSDSIATSNKVGVRVNNSVSPSVTISASSTTPVPGVPLTFTSTQSGGGATPMYQWMLNGVAIPGETNDTYTSSTLSNGDHVALRLLSYDPCANPGVVMSNEIIMGGATGISAASAWEGGLSIFPNPTTGTFTIAAIANSSQVGKRITIDVLNVFGQSVYHSEVAPQRAQWHYDVQLDQSLASGQYILRLKSTDGTRSTKPFTLNR